MKIARFLNVTGDPVYQGLSLYLERRDKDIDSGDWVRVTEYVEVEFPPRDESEVAKLFAKAKQARREKLEKQLAEVA